MSEQVKRYDCAQSSNGWELGNVYMAPRGDGDYVLHEDYARLEAEAVALRAQVARLSASVSDEEWHDLWDKGMLLGVIGNEGATRDGVDTLTAARAAQEQTNASS